jgi:hypothetical protein
MKPEVQLKKGFIPSRFINVQSSFSKLLFLGLIIGSPSFIFVFSSYMLVLIHP